MTDRELLELAAKANGYQVKGWVGEYLVFFNPITGSAEERWNPLNDDGDALRLAAILDLDIQWFPKQRFVSASRPGVAEIIGWVDDSDRAGALRRAITVAAAKIGKSL